LQTPAEQERERRRLKRLKAKPDKLRKELYEIILRKRIFLTDRLERLEKLLMVFGLVTVDEMADQQIELMERS